MEICLPASTEQSLSPPHTCSHPAKPCPRSILCGAAYGRLVGIFVAAMHPSHAVDEGTYALLGAASFLGGSMRLTVCTCVMLLELTNNLALLPMVMLVLLVAKVGGCRTGGQALGGCDMRRLHCSGVPSPEHASAMNPPRTPSHTMHHTRRPWAMARV